MTINEFFKRNKYAIIALLSYILTVVLFTDLTNRFQLATLLIAILTMPPLFNFKITVRSFWISLLTGSFISIYLMPPGFHSIAVDSQPVNAFITFPNQGVVMFWVMIVVLNVMNGLHRSINLTRLTAVKENLADKRDDVLDELLTPIKRRLKDINYFL